MKKSEFKKKPLAVALLCLIATFSVEAKPDASVSNELKAFLAEQPQQDIPAPPKNVRQTQLEAPPEISQPKAEIENETPAAIRLPVSQVEEIPVVESKTSSYGNGTEEDGPPNRADINVDELADAIVRNEERSRYGNPPSYYALGKRYNILQSGKGYHDRGIASWYGTKFHNKPTSSREPYDMFKMTAAHKTLPIPCFVRVTNLKNGKNVIVRVNDRGPFHENRIIDLSYVAAKKLEILGHGTGLVDVQLLESGDPGPVKIDHQPEIYLQIGAFSQHLNAQLHADKIGKRYRQQVQLTEASLNQHPIWRVQLGPIKSVEESDSLTRSLKQSGFGSALAVVR